MPPPQPHRSATEAPAGLVDHVSRREAAALLGFASVFKVRQLERRGDLHGVRGTMGQAWYPRGEVLAIAARGGASSNQAAANQPPPRRGGVSAAPREGRWSDAALLANLRAVAAPAPGAVVARTVVDLVVDTGITIARAERVYRFWLAHDRHPIADVARETRGRRGTVRSAVLAAAVPAAPTAPPGERRGTNRLERDALIRQLRDPDPDRRTQAFRRLRNLPAGPPPGQKPRPDT